MILGPYRAPTVDIRESRGTQQASRADSDMGRSLDFGVPDLTDHTYQDIFSEDAQQAIQGVKAS